MSILSVYHHPDQDSKYELSIVFFFNYIFQILYSIHTIHRIKQNRKRLNQGFAKNIYMDEKNE